MFKFEKYKIKTLLNQFSLSGIEEFEVYVY